MNELKKMHTGEIYDPADGDVVALQTACLERLYEYNATRPSEGARRTALLTEMLAEVGENCYIEPPFHANWGGRHLHLGKCVYANFGFTAVDDTHIYVGDYTLFGPNVVLATAGHPIDPTLRARGLQYNMPIRIGRNCWLGAGVLVMPGVTIGDNCVIGAGSVVTKDIPANTVAYGTPCRPVREIGEQDRAFYFKDRPVPPHLFGQA